MVEDAGCSLHPGRHSEVASLGGEGFAATDNCFCLVFPGNFSCPERERRLIGLVTDLSTADVSLVVAAAGGDRIGAGADVVLAIGCMLYFCITRSTAVIALLIGGGSIASPDGLLVARVVSLREAQVFGLGGIAREGDGLGPHRANPAPNGVD